MIIVRFPDEATTMEALGFLIGKYPGHSWESGEVAVPEEALAALAHEGLKFTVEGPLTHDKILSLRTAAAAEVQ